VAQNDNFCGLKGNRQMSKEANEDNRSYWRYTGPQRMNTAVNTLKGILIGIGIDGVVSTNELKPLRNWLKEHEDLSTKCPFNEAYALVEDALADGILEDEEKEDILWFCDKFVGENSYYSMITSELQILHGILGGIAADGIITKEELEGLDDWLSEHEHLKGNWPFDELETLILEVLRDGKIDDHEHKLLMTFFAEFLVTQKHKAIGFPLNEVEKDITALCAVCPDIEVKGKTFCFTGKFKGRTRNELKDIVENNGAFFVNKLNRDVHCLVIGADGNPSWAFSCYGRKVEKAVGYRKQGINIIFAHEYDFWDSIQDSSN